jgi:hypothetical protein
MDEASDNDSENKSERDNNTLKEIQAKEAV